MILIDATPLIGLFDPADELHARAREDFRRLTGRRLFLCGPVLSEACFALPHPNQRAQLHGLIERFDIRPATDDEPGLWLGALDWMGKYHDHTPDFADACLAVLSGREPKYKVWTYDREFETIWRRPDGSRIPLAVPARRK